MKHKIEYTEGCTVTGCTVNDKDINYVNPNIIISIFKSMIDNMKDSDIIDFIIEYCKNYGKVEFEGHCDECGDNIIKYTLEIDEEKILS